MPYYTICKSLVTNNDPTCNADLLNTFPQTNALRVCVDKTGKILKEFQKEADDNNNHNLFAWTDLMIKTGNFVNVDIGGEIEIEDIYLEVALKSPINNKLFLYNYAEKDNIIQEGRKFYVDYKNNKIQLFDKNSAIIEINEVLQNNNPKNISLKNTVEIPMVNKEKKILNKNIFLLTLLSTLMIGFVYLILSWNGIFSKGNNGSPESKSYFIPTQNNKNGIVIFVHGIFGNSTKTWENSISKSNFTKIVQSDTLFKDYDVFSFGFNSNEFSKSLSISELSESLRSVFETNHIYKYKKIIFICHSMGGLVTRTFIQKYRDEEELASKIKLIYFYSTPTNGSSVANWAAKISKNSQLENMTQKEGQELIDDAQSSWMASKTLTNIPSYCAYEVLPFNGVQIVDRSSATILINRRSDPLEFNHIDMVKPKDKDDQIYLVFRNAFIMEKIK